MLEEVRHLGGSQDWVLPHFGGRALRTGLRATRLSGAERRKARGLAASEEEQTFTFVPDGMEQLCF